MSDKPRWGSGVSEAMKADMKRVREEKAARFNEAAISFAKALEEIRPRASTKAVVYLDAQSFFALASIAPAQSFHKGGNRLVITGGLALMPIVEL